MKQAKSSLLVNFGGPRSLEEVQPFLRSLLTDQEVIRTDWPAFLHRLLFNRVADKRAKTVRHDYAAIGGKSPIYEDTEALARALEEELGHPVLSFHRYLPATHEEFLQRLAALPGEIEVFPLFPQFSYATTGSIALWFHEKAAPDIVQRMRWVPSYASHPLYIAAFKETIRTFLHEKQIPEEEALLFFSAHGLPQSFITTGDIYQRECEATYNALKSAFPHASSLIAYQSQFGKEEWLRPYTRDACEEVTQYGKQHVIFIPLSFTSDHIETLFEIEEMYLPVVANQGIKAWRCPALNRRPDWIRAMAGIIREERHRSSTAMLMRHK